MLKEMLVENGYSLPVAGKFDTLTETAVKGFQLNNNLVSNGQV